MSQKLLGIDIPEGLRKSNFYALFLSTAFIMAVYMIPTIVLPRFLKEVIGVPQKSFGEINSAIQNIGTITSILFLSLIGSLSDRHGRKILLLSGLSGATLSFILYYYSPVIGNFLGINPLWLVFLFSLLLSLSMTFAFPQIVTLVADYTDRRSRGKSMAIMSTMMGVGITLSFIFFSLIQKRIGSANVFLIGAFFMFLTLIVVKFFIVDHMPHKSKEMPVKRNSVIKTWKEDSSVIEKSQGLKVCFFSHFAASSDRIMLGVFLNIWVVRVAGDFNITPAKATAMCGIIIGLSSMVALVSTMFWGIFVDRFGRMPVLAFGLLSSGIGFSLIGIISNPFSLEVKLCGILTGLGVAAVSVSTSSLTADFAPKKILGSVFSISNAIGFLGTLFFVQLGGFLFDYVGFSRPFSLVGAIELIAFIYVISKWKHVPKITRDTKISHEIQH